MSLPRVVNLQWGRISIEQPNLPLMSYKDARICPSRSDEWDWGLTGTQHQPGIQWADFADLLNEHPDTQLIIFSKGMHNQLHVHPETLHRLSVQYPQITVYHLNTREAADLYNKMRMTHRIIGLFHSTC